MSARVAGAGGAVAGARLAFTRMRLRGPLLVALLAWAVSAVVGMVEHASAPLDAPGRVVALVLDWVVPLSAFALVSLATGARRLDDALWCLARHGLSRRGLSLGMVVAVAALAASVAVSSIVVALVLAYRGMPGLTQDLMVSSWVAALGAAAYVGWFALGSSFWRLGRGRWLPLIADFVVGGGTGVLAMWWPRAHLHSLAGGELVLGLPQRTSSVMLAGLAICTLLMSAWRAGD